MTHSEIIQSLKEADGPDRSIDGLIAHFLSVSMPNDPAGWPPSYTKSLDAALTLVPNDMWWLVGCGQINPTEPLYGAQIRKPGFSTGGEIVCEAEHKCMAIALCIAALTAHGNDRLT